MKKLIFLFAFAFIGQQVFSQIYTLSTQGHNSGHPSNCPTFNYAMVMTKIDPAGNATYTCIPTVNPSTNDSQWIVVQQEINSILNLGYKVIGTPCDFFNKGNSNYNSIITCTWYFAIPWTTSGLEEVSVNSTTLKRFNISPNPATDFIDISLDYDLKGESEVVFISEAGYVYRKENISNISKNEKYNIDISKIPAGKYLVTIVNGKTYTTPQKLIIL